MASRHRVPLQLAQVVGIAMPLAAVLWLAPLLILDRQQEAQRNRQSAQVVHLAEVTEGGPVTRATDEDGSWEADRDRDRVTAAQAR